LIAYLDASVLVALLTDDALNPRAEAFVTSIQPVPLLSDFAAAEFVSVISRRLRAKLLTQTEARDALSAFDVWTAGEVSWVECTPADIARATAFMRRLDLPLRTPDAIHIAIAQRVGATLATFDAQMVASARVLGVSVAAA